MTSHSTNIDPVVANIRPRGIRLFCFPHAGGSAASFYPWQRLMSPSIDVYPVELPGRATRFQDTHATSLPALIDDLLARLSDCFTTPYAFFGHSMGALVAFELARRLRQQRRREPLALLASARPAPQIRVESRWRSEQSKDELIDELRSFGGTDPDILENKELMELVLPILRADLGMHERYRYMAELPFSFPIFAYGGHGDSTLNVEDLDRLAASDKRLVHPAHPAGRPLLLVRAPGGFRRPAKPGFALSSICRPDRG